MLLKSSSLIKLQTAFINQNSSVKNEKQEQRFVAFKAYYWNTKNPCLTG